MKTNSKYKTIDEQKKNWILPENCRNHENYNVLFKTKKAIQQ